MERELKNSINYIDKKTSKKTGFSTPSSYLNNLEEEIIIKLTEEKFSKKLSFETPKNYFDLLEDNLLANISLPKKEVKVISIKKNFLKAIPYAAAASILLFIGLNTFVFNTSNDNIFDKLSDNEVETWISDNINLISSTDIALTYNDIEFDVSEMIPNSISNDDLENYLSNQNDISLILEND